jgi:transcriptional regulator with XRE-family HTH domain
MFVDGVRRSSALITGPTTIHLGAADGIPVSLTTNDPAEPAPLVAPADAEADDEDKWDELSETDPDVARAGRAVAARRRELDITQRSLARDKIINAGTLIAFEKGRSWPRRGTLAKLEDGEATEVLTDTVRAPLMAEAVELAMHAIATALAALPQDSEPEFAHGASSVLADVRKLEAVASNAARNSRGAPSVVLALSSVRRAYNDLMLRAARSRSATLGQRLYGARHQAELSIDEAANAAGIATTVLEDAESERPVPPDAAAAIETLIAQLAMS